MLVLYQENNLMTDCYDMLKNKKPHPEEIFVKRRRWIGKQKMALNLKLPNRKKRLKRQKRKKKIQQINTDQPTNEDDDLVADEAAQYLQGVHDLGILDLPFSDYE